MKKKAETYQLLFYSESCTPKFKKFKTVPEAEAFAGQFILKHKAADTEADNWVDCLIKDVVGGITVYTQGVQFE